MKIDLSDIPWRRRNRGLILVGLAALAIGGWYCVSLGEAERDQREVARARASFRACLIGQPLAEGESADSRIRRVGAAASSEPDSDWPRRCAPHAEALEQALGDDSGIYDSASTLIGRGDLFENGSLASSIKVLLGDDDDPAGTPAKGVPAAPEPVEPRSDLTPLSPAWPLHFWEGPGSQGLLLTFPDDFQVCHFRPEGGGLEPVARCRYAPDAVPIAPEGRLDVVPGDSSSEVLVRVTGQKEGTGLYSLASGEKVAPAPRAYYAAAFAGKDALLVYDGGERRTDIIRRDQDGTRQVSMSRPRGDRVEERVLVRDQLMWVEDGAVYARAVGDPEPGPVIRLGEAAGSPQVQRACATADALFVPISDRRAESYRIAALADGRWVLTDTLPTSGRPDCAGSTAIVTAAGRSADGARVTRIECGADGSCAEATAEIDRLPGTGKSGGLGDGAIVGAGAAGDAVVLVWVDDLVRAKVAPLSELADAPIQHVYEGRTGRSPHSSVPLVHDVKLLIRGTSAIVLLRGQSTYAVHLSPEQSEPVSVVYD